MRQSAAKRIITPRLQAGYVVYLREAERAPSTINKYKRSIARLAEWLNGRPATKEEVLTWKHRLAEQGMSPSSVNSAIAAANGFFRYAGWYDLQTRYLRVQRKAFRDSSRDLTLEEYRALVRQAYKVGDIPVALAMETIASTGIRVSELAYITVEVVRWSRRHLSQGQDPRDHAALAFKGETARLLQYPWHSFWSGHCGRRRAAVFASASLGKDEVHKRGRGRGSQQSLSAQPAAPLRHYVLPGKR